MANVAELVFTGVIALVAARGERPFTAVLPNDSIFTNNHEHEAYLLIRYRNTWEITVTGYSEDRVDAATGTKYCFVPLKGAQLALKGVESSTFIERSERVFYRRRPVRSTDSDRIHWIAKLSSVWPQQPKTFLSGVINGELARDLVQARIEVAAGILKSEALSGRASIWRMSPRPGIHLPFERAMAQGAVVEVQVQDALILSGKDAAGDIEVRVKRTGAAPFISDEPLRIVVGNTPHEDILPDGSACCKPAHHVCPMANDPCSGTCVDEHFKLYYQLFAGQADEPPLPRRIEYFLAPRPARETQARRAMGGNCPPVRVEVSQ